MKDAIITILKTLIGFIAFWTILYLVFVCFTAIDNIQSYRNVWEEGFESLYSTFKNVRVLVYLIPLITIFSLIVSLIVGFIKNKFKKVKFDYKNEYQKFKPKSRVKITFMDGTKEVTKKVRIISINAKGISFEDKESVYECTPSEIKNIRKRNKKLLALIAVFTVLVLIILADTSIQWVVTPPRHSTIEPESCEGVVGPCL